MKRWTYDPHSGGSKIPLKRHEEICKQLESFERTRPWYPDIQLKVRFKGQFCYIDTLEKRDGEDRLFPLCRLRHLSRGQKLQQTLVDNLGLLLLHPMAGTGQQLA